MRTIAEYFDEEAGKHDVHFCVQMGMKEFYDEVETVLNHCPQRDKVLVLGCGTGLEIERIKFEAEVTAVDLSAEMLKRLTQKKLHSGVRLNTVHASLLDYDFGENCYDIVLSCYVLHHFNLEQRRNVLKKVFRCLKEQGRFINGDIMAKSKEEEQERMRAAEMEYLEKGMPFASLHIDVPITYETECELLQNAGGDAVMLVRESERAKLYQCIK